MFFKRLILSLFLIAAVIDSTARIKGYGLNGYPCLHNLSILKKKNNEEAIIYDTTTTIFVQYGKPSSKICSKIVSFQKGLSIVPL